MSAAPRRNENERRAIVWASIERMAFHPRNPRQWLAVFAKNLAGFWQIEPAVIGHLHLHGQFYEPFLGLSCSYWIGERPNAKYGARIFIKDDSIPVWQIETDPSYCSQSSLSVSVEKHDRRDSGCLRKDVSSVLDGMIFHPRCHSHLSSLGVACPSESNDQKPESMHEIRLGGGIENPYVFLLHIRYQFCLIEEIRKAERDRLIELFKNAIKQGRRTGEVSANDLLQPPG